MSIYKKEYFLFKIKNPAAAGLKSNNIIIIFS